MNYTLSEQLKVWHEEDEHQAIVDALLAVPADQRDYEWAGLLARAYNNLGQYEEAFSQLERVAEAGAQDPLWHYRAGYSLYYLKRYEDAVQALQTSRRLASGDPDLEESLKWILQKAEKQLKNGQRLASKQEEASKHGGQPAAVPFTDMPLADFWEDSEYAGKAYHSPPFDEELLASVEEELGYKLPASYVALMRQRNGGVPRNTCFPTEDSTSWAEDHIAIMGILGIGREKSYSLCGGLGSPFMIEEWGYPDIGVVICDCPSAGHDLVMLDYRACGRDGEPAVIHVDQESDYEITFLADDFEAFIRGLVSEEEFDY
nr:SMI1/KNR4 family protein [Paenibacillus tepidiphilus]